MKHLKKTLIDTFIMSGLLLIIAVFQKSPETIYKTLIPVAAIACCNFLKLHFHFDNNVSI